MPPEIPIPPGPPGAAAGPKPPGGPGGPGATPMMSPGAGLGAQASAINKIKDLQRGVLEAINQFPQGSKEQQALLRVAQTLSIFVREGPGGPPPGGVPPGIAAMNAPGGPPPGAPPGGPPGIPGGPPMPPGGGPEIGAPA
ncbi:MAG TPA: hypothetical protein VF748_00010 [Candidatus Acidoferrum sp.]